MKMFLAFYINVPVSHLDDHEQKSTFPKAVET